MNYYDMMARTAEMVQDAGVATKILQHMDRIRNNKSEESARRWVWELIQNAKDVARDGAPVHIKIERTQTELRFAHDGKPFLVKNILSMINQISSKTNDEESTGMFGTGFITTHQLSPVVTLNSIIQDKIVQDGIAQQLPFKEFEVVLDRSGEDIDSITASVKKSLDVIRNLDAYPDVEYQPEAYNTQLRYALETKDAQEIARKALADLAHSIFYALIFVEDIATVTVVEDGAQTVYRKGSVTPLTECVSEHLLYQNQRAFRFLSAQKEGTMIALPVACDENRLLEISEHTPKLSVDFPLVGSEQFPLPYVCNSHALHPSEKRNWAPISSHATRISNQNKAVMGRTVSLYGAIVSYVAQQNYQDLHLLAKLLPIPKRGDLDATWFAENIHDAIIEVLLSHKIFLVNGAHQKMEAQLCIPFSEQSDQEALEIAQTMRLLAGVVTVDNPLSWNEILRNQPAEYREKFHRVSLEDLANRFLKKEDATTKEGTTYIEYLSAVYHLFMQNETMQNQILTNQLAIFPNMCTPVQLCTADNIADGADIPDEYIDIFEEVDLCGYENYQQARNMQFHRFDAKKTLVHKAFDFGNTHPLVKKTLKGYLRNLNSAFRFNNAYMLSSARMRTETVLKIAHLRNDEAYLALFARIGTAEQRAFTVQYERIITGDTEDFSYYYEFLLRNFLSALHQYRTLEQMSEALALREEECCAQITHLMQLVQQQHHEALLNLYNALPNENGEFRFLRALYRNNHIDPHFLAIATLLQGVPNSSMEAFDHKLLDKRVSINLPMQSYHNESVASKILNTVDRLLAQGELVKQAESHQEACARLLAWINENPEGAAEYFPSFASEDARMRLMSSKTASRMNKKIRLYEQTLKENGIASLEELMDVLKTYQNTEPSQEDSTEEAYIAGDDGGYFGTLTSNTRAEYLRAIGNAGEEILFAARKKSYLEKGFALVAQSPRVYQLQKDDVEVLLEKPDTDSYKQKGYDVCETITQGGESIRHYYEVKTTTDKNRKHVFKLSNAQFNLALSAKERFSVVLVYLTPKSLAFRFIEHKQNFFANLQQNEVCCLNEEFLFRV